MSRKTLRLVIHSCVQGVFFRDSMRAEGQRLGIAGWVRNRRDGTVEADSGYHDLARVLFII